MVQPLDTHVKVMDTKAFEGFKDLKAKREDEIKFTGKGLDLSSTEMKVGHTTIIGKIKHYFQSKAAAKNPELRQQVKNYNDSVKQAFIDKVKQGAGESMRKSLENLMNDHEKMGEDSTSSGFSFFSAIAKRDFINRAVADIEKVAGEIATEELDKKMGKTGQNKAALTGGQIQDVLFKIETALNRVEHSYNNAVFNVKTYVDNPRTEKDENHVPEVLESLPKKVDEGTNPRFREIGQFSVMEIVKGDGYIGTHWDGEYFK